MVNLTAISLSQVIKMRWSDEQTVNARMKNLWNASARLLSIPSELMRRKVSHTISDGCTTKPVSASFAAKQASKMLVLLWRLRRFFTAIITNALSTTVKGQVMPLMIIRVMILISCATFRVSPCVVTSVTFVKFDPQSLAIFRKHSVDKLTSRIARGFLYVVFSIESPPVKRNICFPLTFPKH